MKLKIEIEKRHRTTRTKIEPQRETYIKIKRKNKIEQTIQASKTT